MKTLVLAALVAAAASAGCAGNGGSTITVTWDFTHLADNSPRSCPTGFDTVRVIAQPVDPTTHLGAGITFVDVFDCEAGVGRVKLADDAYLVWIEVTNFAETQTYATSNEQYYDTLEGNVTLPFEILDDGGYISLTWDLVDAFDQSLLSCSEAGIVGGDTSVDITATLSGTMSNVTDRFDCEDHFGTTAGLLAGTYVISVAAYQGQDAFVAPAINNVRVSAPNDVTYIGNVKIPID